MQAKRAPIKPTVSFDALDKIDVRVGAIDLVEDIMRHAVQSEDEAARLRRFFPTFRC